MNKRDILITATALVVFPVAYYSAMGDPTPPPCEFEDSVSCYWDASTQGNGEGFSFTVDAAGEVTYDDPESYILALETYVDDAEDYMDYLEGQIKIYRDI